MTFVQYKLKNGLKNAVKFDKSENVVFWVDRIPLIEVREYYYIAIFARVLESELSDTSSLDYPPIQPIVILCDNR